MQIRPSRAAAAVAQIANQEAMRLDDDFIGTEHILTGLANDQGVAGIVLREHGVEVAAIQHILDTWPRNDPAAYTAQQGQAKDAFGWALEEATRLYHLQLEPEHILLGILRDPHCRACQILVDLGVSLEYFQTTLLDRILPGSAAEVERIMLREKRHATEPRVQALKQKIDDLQVKKEQAVTAADFPRAASFRDQQRAIEQDLDTLYNELGRQSGLSSE